jgi:hypothetical protein
VFRRKDKPGGWLTANSPGPGLRMTALSLQPGSLGLAPAEDDVVWGVLMDTGITPEGWHCLLVLADGTTSMYTSAAFGIIGAGQHASVRAPSTALLAVVQANLALFTPDESTDTPAGGQVAIRALTWGGRRLLVAPEADLGEGRHPASAIFIAGHDVITQMRLITQSRL